MLHKLRSLLRKSRPLPARADRRARARSRARLRVESLEARTVPATLYFDFYYATSNRWEDNNWADTPDPRSGHHYLPPPGPGDDVVIDNPQAGYFNPVYLSSAATINSLRLGYGDLYVEGSLTVFGATQLTAQYASLQVDGPTYADGGITDFAAAYGVNVANHLSVGGDSYIGPFEIFGGGVLESTGVLHGLYGHVDAGGLLVNYGGIDDSAFMVGQQVRSSTLAFEDGSDLRGGGFLHIDGGYLQVQTNDLLAPGDFRLTDGPFWPQAYTPGGISNGPFGGDGRVVVLGTFRWGGGIIAQSSRPQSEAMVYLGPYATAHITGSQFKELNGTVDNDGTVRLHDTATTGDLEIDASGLLQSQGTIVFHANANVKRGTGDTLGRVWNNAGTVIKKGGDTSEIDVLFDNSFVGMAATVDVKAGTLNLQGGGNWGGTLSTIDPAGTLQIGNGDFKLTGGNVIVPGNRGEGRLLIGGGFFDDPTIEVQGAGDQAVIEVSTTMTQGIWEGPGTVDITDLAVFNWQGGSFGAFNPFPITIGEVHVGPLATMTVDLHGTAGMERTAALNGLLQNDGVVHVAAGTVLRTASFAQGSGGDLQLDLGGTDYFAQLRADQAQFAGTLDVSLAAGYTPTTGDTFDLVAYRSRGGTMFDQINLPGAWSVQYRDDFGVLEIVAQ